MFINKHRFFPLLFSFTCMFLLCLQVNCQDKKPLKGTVQRIKVHGKELEGNLEGDSADRWVSVYLPPGYEANPGRRYPVIYFLHGYTDDDDKFYGSVKHWMNLAQVLDSVFTSGKAREMIVVTPNAYTRFQGSMYSNSVTTGNWEDFIAKELVSYIDKHYRTIAKASGRGLAGHSMGGYGTLRISQKNPEIFSGIYLLSPCCLAPNLNTIQISPSYFKADSIHTFADFEKADFGIKALFAYGAAWSPDPLHPPFYMDLPVENGKFQPAIQAKWDANRPLVTLDQYITRLKKLHAIAFDAGTKDQGIAASIKVLDEDLNQIRHCSYI